MNYKKLDRVLNEIKTELYVPKGKQFLNVSLRSTFDDNGNRLNQFPPAWKTTIKEIIQTITNAGLAKEFAKDDADHIDVIGAKPMGTIMLQNDMGKKYSYNTATKTIKAI